MKSLFFTLVISAFLTLSFTACSSDSKKTEAPKAADEKSSTAIQKTAVTKPKAVSSSADKANVATTTLGALTCTHGSDSRSIEIKSPGAGCELMYTKNGDAKSIATAKNGTTYCAGVSEKLAKNLSAAGFSCK